jgi:hypothetical protein
MAEFFGELPPRERVKQFRLLAAKSYALAQSATDEKARAHYLAIANSWHNLSLESERAAALVSTDDIAAFRQEEI